MFLPATKGFFEILIMKKKRENTARINMHTTAGAVECSKDTANPLTFFRMNGENSRLGKKIREIKLKVVASAKEEINAILLLGISVSECPKVANAKGMEAR